MDVLFVWGVIWFLYWANTQSLKDKLSRLDQSFEATSEREYLNNQITRFGASAMASSIGALVGMFIGIAGFGTAIAGTVPCAILAGVIGWLAVGNQK